MILKVILSHEEEGSIQIPEPDGWDKAEVGIERDPVLKGMAPFLKTPFNASGEFREWCLLVERNHGPDAIITAKLRYSPDERGLTFYELFPNSDIEIAVGSFTETVGHELGHGLEYGFVLKSFLAKFQQRFETPVNVQSTEDLDGNPVEVLEATEVEQSPQIIDMRFANQSKYSQIFNNLDPLSYHPIVADEHIQVGFNDNISLDEIKARFDLSTAVNPEIPVAMWTMEYGGILTPDWRITMACFSIDFPGPFNERFQNMGANLKWYIQINDQAPVEFDHATETIVINYLGLDLDTILNYYTLTDPINVNAGDNVRIYAKLITDFDGTSANNIYIIADEAIDGNGGGPFEVVEKVLAQKGTGLTYSNFTHKTTFPATVAEGFLTHDLLAATIKRICGADFYSECLGSPNTLARQYDYRGCFADFMHYKGLQLRQYLLSEKPFFASVKDIWNGINPVHCLAMGVDRVDGQDVIRVWRLNELFDETRVSATFDNVRDISRSYDQEEFFNYVRIGYEKGFLQDVGTIDDAQTKRDYTNILKKIGHKIEILSTMIGASLAFEVIRRFTRIKSADHQFDNEIFIQAVRLNGEYGFVPELSEEFSDVTNLLNEETRYNKRIVTARNFLNWLDYLSGCLQAYPDTSFKFNGGEGNYDMQATMTPNDCPNDFEGAPLSEKQDIPISENYLFWPILYNIRCKINFGQWLQIIGDMNAAIRISQSTSGHMPFFTKSLSVKISESMMTLSANPKRFFPLRNVQNNETEHENRTGRRFDDTFGPQFN